MFFSVGKTASNVPLSILLLVIGATSLFLHDSNQGLSCVLNLFKESVALAFP